VIVARIIFIIDINDNLVNAHNIVIVTTWTAEKTPMLLSPTEN